MTSFFTKLIGIYENNFFILLLGTFTESYTPTVEDTYRQVISCGKQQNVCTLQITDTTGSHQFPAMQRLAISKGHAFILVYSIDKPDSFLELENIFDEIKLIKGTDLDVCIYSKNYHSWKIF